ncbi:MULTISPECIES: Crp/Fnr family transcriptional regulator [Exiguobacterium]|uniref:Crp/Fnr family transcriptional regulator n=1 Tax=Exiguobacterium TaxID=33986 RepID=UPI000877798F|nr:MULTISPECIES: Crp/Fnr family transcriptional regulator [Exiguobacterium]TCI35085.1 Crp/Fnr family transcriptional regulator [Exiguobacterium sp. SH4S7]TCI44632.1 Crp/Fnr family transcriptional regulator [Exiguobacterium sp. SH5S32]TCI51038.1 Crp/Fnr family transcriptional regulator [Exiguobacterium sp. SH1S4]TCI53297.1 Crp/Fnr family transcriptional regulator [Exiguobacterium sp. SH1S21]TCI59780.1 Crp/Fnr family transcriptional regulator [Exiguobacterium sp. SH0S2]
MSTKCGTTEPNSFIFSAETKQLLLEMMTPQDYPKASIVCWEGEKCDKFFYLKSGSVKFTKITKKGNPIVMFLYGADDFFGEFDIVDTFPSSYSIETTEESVIGVISKKDIETIMQQDAKFAGDVLRWTSMMRKHSEMKLRDLLLYGKPGALASTLLRMAAMHGVEEDDAVVISRHPSDGELGQLIGAPRETVNRMMNQWRKEGVLTTTGNSIVLHDIDFLKELCHCEGCPAGICRL